MMFKKSKHEVLDQIRGTVSSSILYHLDQYHVDSSFRVNSGDLTNQIKFAINKAINDAFETFIENIYTDNEFEKDLNLR